MRLLAICRLGGLWHKIWLSRDIRDQPSQGISQEVELGLTKGPTCMLSLLLRKNLIQEVESGLTTQGLTIWANPCFLMWRSGPPQAPPPKN